MAFSKPCGTPRKSDRGCGSARTLVADTRSSWRSEKAIDIVPRSAHAGGSDKRIFGLGAGIGDDGRRPAGGQERVDENIIERGDEVWHSGSALEFIIVIL